MDSVWLSNDIFNWAAYSQGGSILYELSWRRSYEIWKRACDLIEKNDTPFDLNDGIANLKRSLNHRLTLIEEIYHFKNISFLNKPKGYLELLGAYNIVRPFIMKNLLIIRNNIEHHDSDPPELPRCKELLDITWYFLKSTDAIVQIKKESIYFEAYDNEGNETQYSFSIDFDYNSNTSFKLSGWFPKDMINYKEDYNFFNIDTIDFNGKEKFEKLNLHKDKLETDRWVNGNVSINNGVDYKKIVQIALATY